MYNKLLRKIVPEEAKKLFDRVTNDRISVKKYFAEAKRLTKEYGNAKDLAGLKKIDQMIREEG